MLNYPSIGFVWIMRVFLMMALIIPLLYPLLEKRGFIATVTLAIIFIACQLFAIPFVDSIDNKIIHFILDETILYALGYSSIAVIGLKIRTFRFNEIIILISLCAAALITLIGYNNWEFNPQAYKYPPQSIYIVYGLLVSSILWLLKPILSPITKGRVYTYLSTNSMWLYLWHIIPVFIITIISSRFAIIWFAKFLSVLLIAIIFNNIYHFLIKYLPKRIYFYLK